MAGEHDQRATSLSGRSLKGKWRLESQIGSGGMASVWSARHRNGKRVAIKLLHPELSRDDSVRTRFLREGYVANKVGHPSVVTILDDDDDGELVFLVMELLEGETLSERWKRQRDRRLALEEVLRVADEILDVLAAAHDKEIIHRDVKPANVFLTAAGDVKILDFGIARLHEGPGGTGHTTTFGTALGSPAFMSPEQARARWEFVDARTDLWAVGALMFSTLSGRLVHGSKSSAELVIATATQPAPSLREAWPGAPDVVAAIVNRALAFEREDRWQDARSMQVAVRRARQIDFAEPRQALPSLVDASVVASVVDPAPSRRSTRPGSFGGIPLAARAEPFGMPGELGQLGAPSEPAPSVGETSATGRPPAVAPSVPPGETTTSAPVARPADPGDTTLPPPRPRLLGPAVVLGSFIALGLIGGGVAIGLLSRRPAPMTAAPPAPPPAPAPSALAPSESATVAPTAEASASATASSAASAAPTVDPTPSVSPAPPPPPSATPAPKSKTPPARHAPPPKKSGGKFTPKGL